MPCSARTDEVSRHESRPARLDTEVRPFGVVVSCGPEGHIRRMTFDRDRQRRHKLHNAWHSFLLLAGMTLLLAACGWIVAGWAGVVTVVLLGGVGLILGTGVSPRLVLRLYDARRLPRLELAEVYRIVAALSERAGLAQPPALYYISSPTLNAFSVGRRGDAAIAMTTGLLSRFNLRELAGVLAHELSHVRNNDMWIMGLADVISRLTRSMSFVGIVLLAINAPLLLAGREQIPWLLILLLVFAPTVGTLLQLALSRTREFDADLDAAAMTGDPAGLAAALQKLERYQGRFWEEIVLPGRRVPEPSVLRSHPATEARIERLMELRGEPRPPLAEGPTGVHRHHSMIPQTPRRPRWRRSGFWY